MERFSLGGRRRDLLAIGAFVRRKWARVLGIFGYALNVLVFLLTAFTTTAQGSRLPYIFGTFVAIAFVIVLAFAKSAFEKPKTN